MWHVGNKRLSDGGDRLRNLRQRLTNGSANAREFKRSRGVRLAKALEARTKHLHGAA